MRASLRTALRTRRRPRPTRPSDRPLARPPGLRRLPEPVPSVGRRRRDLVRPLCDSMVCSAARPPSGAPARRRHRDRTCARRGPSGRSRTDAPPRGAAPWATKPPHPGLRPGRSDSTCSSGRCQLERRPATRRAAVDPDAGKRRRGERAVHSAPRPTRGRRTGEAHGPRTGATARGTRRPRHRTRPGTSRSSRGPRSRYARPAAPPRRNGTRACSAAPPRVPSAGRSGRSERGGDGRSPARPPRPRARARNAGAGRRR